MGNMILVAENRNPGTIPSTRSRVEMQPLPGTKPPTGSRVEMQLLRNLNTVLTEGQTGIWIKCYLFLVLAFMHAFVSSLLKSKRINQV